jgi:hypothetical protein
MRDRSPTELFELDNEIAHIIDERGQVHKSFTIVLKEGSTITRTASHADRVSNPAALPGIAEPVEADELKLKWRDGAPPHPWEKEWFIAETTYGDRVVLKALPEEYTYDFKTADDTYIKRDKIKRWMQFPDSFYIAPEADPPLSDLRGEIENLSSIVASGIDDVAGGALDDAEERAQELEAENERLRKAVEWYGEQAEAMARYALVIKPLAMEAIVTSMSLDAGSRARAALQTEGK